MHHIKPFFLQFDFPLEKKPKKTKKTQEKKYEKWVLRHL